MKKKELPDWIKRDLEKERQRQIEQEKVLSSQRYKEVDMKKIINFCLKNNLNFVVQNMKDKSKMIAIEGTTTHKFPDKKFNLIIPSIWKGFTSNSHPFIDKLEDSKIWNNLFFYWWIFPPSPKIGVKYERHELYIRSLFSLL